MKTKTAKALPKMMRGSVHRQFKKCGKTNCKCTRGDLHGAHYHFVRVSGKLRKRYIKSRDVEEILAACVARQKHTKERRAALIADWHKFREIRTNIRERRRCTE